MLLGMATLLRRGSKVRNKGKLSGTEEKIEYRHSINLRAARFRRNLLIQMESFIFKGIRIVVKDLPTKKRMHLSVKRKKESADN